MASAEDENGIVDPQILRMQAMEYYKENGVPQRMEEILNSMFFDKPSDVYGHLATYFEGMAAAATLTKIIASETLDSNGQTTVQADVYCSIKNAEKICGRGTLVNNLELENSADEISLSETMGFIEKEMSSALHGCDPTKQESNDLAIYEIISKLLEAQKEQQKEDNPAIGEEAEKAATPDGKLSPSKRKSAKGKKGAAAAVIIPDEPKEKLIPGSGAVCTVSQAVCKTGAMVSNLPLYKHVASLRHGEIPECFKLPIPIVTMLTCGKSAVGKVKGVKDFMVVPKPDMPFKESVKNITNIYHQLCKALVAKSGGKGSNSAACLVTNTGSLFPALDKIEQGIDMLQDAISAVGLAPGKDFFIALDLAAHDIFDYEKGKYEVIVGTQKLPEDLPDFWSEVLAKYPSVIAVIDPTRKADKESWMKLCEKLTEKCLVVGDTVYHRPGLMKNEPITEDFNTSATVLRMEPMTTVSDLIQIAKKMEDADNTVILGSSFGETTDTILADLAVGMNCRYIKIGAPCRGERVAKLNRLLEIEKELLSSECLSSWEPQTFPHIKAPVPPPVEGEESESQKTASDKKTDSKKK